MKEKAKIGVLVSGSGTNLQSIIDYIEQGKLKAKLAIVISNKQDAYGLERARKHNMPTKVISHKDFKTREEFEEEIAKVLEEIGCDFIVLAGFMRVLTPLFIRRFKNRIVNIHPALLPSFPGVDAQKQAFDYGVKVTGCTVHFVDEGVDTGPIILQKVVPVHDGDTVESLRARILEEEHKALPEALNLIINRRIKIEGRRVICNL
jgi:phosphoribosylglycinamide formyltransferase-1